MSISRRLWSAAVVAAAAIGILVVGGADVARATDIDTFHGQSPARLLDTRAGGSTIDGASAGIGAIGGDGQLDLTVVGRGGVPATGVGAVALNITVTGPAAGRLPHRVADRGDPAHGVEPQLRPRPDRAEHGHRARSARAARSRSSTAAPGSVHVIVDVLGWFPTGASFTGLTPARLMDSRVRRADDRRRSSPAAVRSAGTATIDVRVARSWRRPGDRRRRRRPQRHRHRTRPLDRLRHRVADRAAATDRIQPQLRRRAAPCPTW